MQKQNAATFHLNAAFHSTPVDYLVSVFLCTLLIRAGYYTHSPIIGVIAVFEGTISH